MLNISRSIYAGWSPTSNGELPIATIVPKGTTTNEKKKYEKLVKEKKEVRELENIPLPGFTLHTHGRKSWSSSETLWQVIDPRGFTSYITSQNLEEILSVTGITEGLIQEKCVWARQDNNISMSLIPVNTPEYTEAITNTDILANKPKKKEIKIGDTVLLQNGLTGKFMGNLSLYGPVRAQYKRGSETISPTTHPKKDVIEIRPGQFFFASDSKMVKVIESATEVLSKEESVEYINSAIANSGAYMSSNHIDFNSPQGNVPILSYRSTWDQISLVSAKPETPMLAISEIQIDQATHLLRNAANYGDDYMVLLENGTGQTFTVSFGYGKTTFDKNSFIVKQVKFENGKITVNDKQGSYYYARSTMPRTKLDNFVKFYKIEKLIGSESFI